MMLSSCRCVCGKIETTTEYQSRLSFRFMPSDWNTFIDISEKIFTIIAVIVGGLWVYFNSFRGRTFVPRLQLELSGRLLTHESLQFLLVSIQVKNVGSSMVQLRARGTGLKVVSLHAGSAGSQVANLIEKETTAFPVLEKDIIDEKDTTADRSIKNIEPGTAINEQKLVVVSMAKYNAFRLELKVFAFGGRLFWKKLPDRYWTAIAIAAKADQSLQPEKADGR